MTAQPPAKVELPAELRRELVRLFSEALVADLRRFPKLPEDQGSRSVTVGSPRRTARRRPADVARCVVSLETARRQPVRRLVSQP